MAYPCTAWHSGAEGKGSVVQCGAVWCRAEQGRAGQGREHIGSIRFGAGAGAGSGSAHGTLLDRVVHHGGEAVVVFVF